MPSPLSSRGRGTNTSKSSNPFSNWMQKRKERRMEAEEEAAKLITNAIVKNQNAIIDKLSSIDFLHSRLPKSILEAKSSENQKYCDLELATKVIMGGADFQELKLPANGAYTTERIKEMDVLNPNLEKNTQLLHDFIYGADAE